MKIKAGSTEIEPTHHASLSDGKKTVGLIFIDGEGEPNLQAMKADPYPRTALKTTQGNSKYSDFEEPYFSIAQDDFTGGRGNEEFEKDTSRYFDAHMLDTTKETGVILGGLESGSGIYPLPYYCTFSNFNTDGLISWRKLGLANKWIVNDWTPPTGITIRGFSMQLRKVGNPSGFTITFGSYGDSGGAPDINTFEIMGTISTDDLSDEVSEWRFSGENPRVLTASKYYFGLNYNMTVDDPDNYVEVAIWTNDTTGWSWNGASWDAVNDCGMHFQMYVTFSNTTGWKTINYKGALLAFTYDEDIGKTICCINGDWGTVDDSANKKTLTDATKSWQTNIWAGATVVITRGMEIGKNYAKIASNNGTTLTLETSLGEVPAAGDHDYVIVNTHHWQVLDSDVGTSQKFTDVCAAGNNFYVAWGEPGGSQPLYRGQYYCDSSNVWTKREASENVEASKLLYVRHPDMGDVLYGAQNSNPEFGRCIWRGTIPKAWGDLYYKRANLIDLDSTWDDISRQYAHSVIDQGGLHINIEDSFTTGEVAVKNLSEPIDMTGVKQLGMQIKSSVAASNIQFIESESENLTNTFFPTAVLWRYNTNDPGAYKVFHQQQTRLLQPLAVLKDSSGTFTDLPKAYNLIESDDTGETLTMAAGDILWIGCEEKFNKAYFYFGTTVNANAVTSTVYLGQSPYLQAPAPTTTDGTLSSGKTFAQQGEISFKPFGTTYAGHEWRKTIINDIEAYWIAIRFSGALTPSINLDEIYLTHDYGQGDPIFEELRKAENGDAYDGDDVRLYAGDKLYIGTAHPIYAIGFGFGRINSTTATITARYWQGNSWQTFNSITDATASGGATLATDGLITLSYESDWRPSTINGIEAYWVALSVSVDINPVNIIQIIAYRSPISGEWSQVEDLTPSLNGLFGAARGVVLTTGDDLLICSDRRYNKVNFDLGSYVNNNTASMNVYYRTVWGWYNPTGISDGTASGGATLAQDGSYAFTMGTEELPAWERDTINGIEGYWLRIRPSADLDPISFNSISLTDDERYFVWNLLNIPANEWVWMAETPKARTTEPAPDSSNINSLGFNLSSDLGAQHIYVRDISIIDESIDRLLGESVFQLPGSARITGLQAYSGNAELPIENPWIFTEEGVYELQTHNDDLIVPLPVEELSTLASGDNGIAHCVNGTYLYFNLGQKLQRYFNRNLDDIGVDRDAGLPIGRRGIITALESYAGRIFIAVDTVDGLSSVNILKGESVFEIYRTPIDMTGLSIHTEENTISNIHIQAIPGNSPDLIWISQGANYLFSIPIDLNPGNNENYIFRDEGHLVTSWIYANMYDVQKTFKSLKIHAEDLVFEEQFIRVFYQVDNDTTWTLIGDYYESPSQELDIGAINPSAKRIRFKIYLRSNDRSKTPRLRAFILEGVSFVPVKYQRTFNAGLADGEMDIDLEGDEGAEFTVKEKYQMILDWANEGTFLKFECNFALHDNKIVFVHPPSISPIMRIPDEQSEKHAARITVIDV